MRIGLEKLLSDRFRNIRQLRKLHKTDQIALILSILFAIFLFIFGGMYHIIEELGSAEYDGYVAKADQLRIGNIPRDPLHPLLYPILTASFGILFDNTFTGGRVVSSLSASILTFLTYLLGKRCFDWKVGIAAMICLMLNYHVIVEGLHTTNDMLFTAISTACLLVAIRTVKNPTSTSIILLSLLIALAYFTRYIALAFVPAIVLVVLFPEQQIDQKHIIKNLTIFISSVLVFLLPHFILTAIVFGNPFHNESWRIPGAILHGTEDSNLQAIPASGLLEVFTLGPITFLKNAILMFWSFLNWEILNLGGGMLSGILFISAFLGGIYTQLFKLDKKWIVVFAFLSVYVIMIVAFAFPVPRIMLPILPIGYVIGMGFLIKDGFQGSINFGRFHIERSFPPILLIMLILFTSTIQRIPNFIRNHPFQELSAALMLQENFGSEITVLGSNRFLQRYVDYTYKTLKGQNWEEKLEPSEYYDYLEKVTVLRDADYILVGKLSLEKRPENLLKGIDIPSFLEPILINQDIALYKAQMNASTINSLDEIVGVWVQDGLYMQINKNGSITFAQSVNALDEKPLAKGEIWFENGNLNLRSIEAGDTKICDDKDIGIYELNGKNRSFLTLHSISDPCIVRMDFLEKEFWNWISDLG